jgi:hypothetical protein
MLPALLAQKYTPKRITFSGYASVSQAELLAVSGLNPGAPVGDVFDESYAPSFLNRNKQNLHDLDAWSASYKQYANLDSHIVDLVITFRPGGPLN